MSDLNDPRVLFAAERTLLAWNRTSLALIAFGFVIERSGLLIKLLSPPPSTADNRFAFWAGLAFILLGILTSVVAVMQHRTVLRTLKPAEIPAGYKVNLGMLTNIAVAIMGSAFCAYLLLHGPAT